MGRAAFGHAIIWGGNYPTRPIDKPAQFRVVPFRNQFDPPAMFNNQHFPTGAGFQRLPDRLGHNTPLGT